MSGVICFKSQSNEAWVNAGWAFRQVLEDTRTSSPEDEEMAQVLANAEAVGWLYVDSLEPALAARITDAMRRTIEGIQKGEVRSLIHEKNYGTPATVEQYVDSLAELWQLLPSPLK
jgi:hypothetical protein